MNDPKANREVARLRKEVTSLQAQMAAREVEHELQSAAREVAHEQQLAAAQAQIDAAGRVSEALGKAIALLHAHSESADSTTGD